MPAFTTQDILAEAVRRNSKASLNELHEVTYHVMLEMRELYYSKKVDAFLDTLDLDKKTQAMIRAALLQPIDVKDKRYSNFMEETSRRVSQTFQVISGNLAEAVVERSLNKLGLEKNRHYKRRENRTDITMYYPSLEKPKAKHRVEVKNVKMRERGTRGLSFDGDSLIGFFDDATEFTTSTIKIVDAHCRKTKGCCYMPPATLKALGARLKGKRFKSNEEFAQDMKRFVFTGSI